ncbi:hypothetical protein CP10139811_0019 [Chlamydia ibidis]|uniref:Uncharacterized protein n=2 Tax=Chlamydia ibidis TaxID=1405396 RepID=S7KHJ1_9CHLA|nr:hypothetical protein CP10139811_0019 [Chlamydia ibidis]EQM62805.1 hypothetical protein H359_0464 [Chlamydia ibidis 10-1398/6]
MFIDEKYETIWMISMNLVEVHQEPLDFRIDGMSESLFSFLIGS